MFSSDAGDGDARDSDTPGAAAGAAHAQPPPLLRCRREPEEERSEAAHRRGAMLRVQGCGQLRERRSRRRCGRVRHTSRVEPSLLCAALRPRRGANKQRGAADASPRTLTTRTAAAQRRSAARRAGSASQREVAVAAVRRPPGRPSSLLLRARGRPRGCGPRRLPATRASASAAPERPKSRRRRGSSAKRDR
jgi:hypothetical protein